MRAVTKAILDGKSIRMALCEGAELYANDSFGYSLKSTLEMLLGDTQYAKFDPEKDEGVYEFYYAKNYLDFDSMLKKISKKFPGWSFTYQEIEKDSGVIYVLKVKKDK